MRIVLTLFLNIIKMSLISHSVSIILLPLLVKDFCVFPAQSDCQQLCCICPRQRRSQLTRSSAALSRPTSFLSASPNTNPSPNCSPRPCCTSSSRLTGAVAKRKVAPAALTDNFCPVLIMINVNNSAWHTNAIKGLQLQLCCESKTS